MNKTKVVVTIGHNNCSEETLKNLFINGVDVIRLNLAHVDYTFCKKIIKKVNELNDLFGFSVAIMLDTEGQSIRTGEFYDGRATFEKGSKIRIFFDERKGNMTEFSINEPQILKNIKYADIFTIDDGHLQLKVLEKGMDYIKCEVLKTATILSNTKVHIPSYRLNKNIISKKDEENIKFANKVKADFLTVSGVKNAEDFEQVKDRIIETSNDHITLLAKIENKMALENVEEIISRSDGIVLARGDLRLEVPYEKVPSIKQNIINICQQQGKISVIMTEIHGNPDEFPSKEEVSDIAGTVSKGADAILFAGDITDNPNIAKIMTSVEKVLTEAEKSINYEDFYQRSLDEEATNITSGVITSTVRCANLLHCKAIITPTVSGYTAKKMSRLRPPCPIVAAAHNIETVKSLMLYFGVLPVLISELKSFDRVTANAKEITKKYIGLREKDIILITGGYPFQGLKKVNFMRIEEL